MCLPASLAKRTAAPFRSSSSPMRRSGVPAASFSTPTASIVPFVILDGKKPGARALAVIPYRPQLPARARVKINHRALARIVGNHLHIPGTSEQARDRSKVDNAAIFVGNHRVLRNLLAEQEQRADIQIH